MIPPFSIENEMAALGAMIIDRKALESGIQQLDEGCFYEPRNKTVFVAIRRLCAAGNPVDYVSLRDELKRMDRLGEVDGGYMVDLTNSLATAVHFPYYVQVLQDKKILRHIINEAERIVHKAHDGTSDEAVNSLLALADEVSGKRAGVPVYYTPKEYHAEYIEYLEALRDRKPELLMGIPSIDTAFWGLHKGEVVTIGARTGIGKSVFSLNIAANLVKNGRKVLYFSTEMAVHEKWSRLMSLLTQIPAYKFRRGEFLEAEWKEVGRATERLWNSDNFIVCDLASPGISEVRALVNRVKPDICILDYLGQFSFQKADRMDLEIGNFMKQVKVIARAEKVAMIVPCQLNRQADTRKTPVLADLRDSGVTEQASDAVLLLYEDTEPEFLGTLVASIEKNRHGKKGIVRLGFNRETLQIRELEVDIEDRRVISSGS